jgi:hypothetical protein
LALASLALVVQFTLPRPNRKQRLVARVLSVLHRSRATSAVASIARRRFTARCRILAAGKELVVTSDGARLLVDATRVKPLAGSRRPAAIRAHAYLAGCPRLLGRMLRRRLLRGRPVYVGHRGAGYELLLADAPAVVVLVVSPTFTPVEIRYRAGRTRGSSRLH